MTDYVEQFQEPREAWAHGYFNWVDEDQITDAEQHTARDGFDAGATWMERQQEKQRSEIREEAWKEYLKRSNYTPDQRKTFMAGMCVMWRLVDLDKKPLFTYGPDNCPNEISKMIPFKLGDWVQIPHFEGGLSQSARIVEFRADHVRVENSAIELTAWWPKGLLIQSKDLNG